MSYRPLVTGMVSMVVVILSILTSLVPAFANELAPHGIVQSTDIIHDYVGDYMAVSYNISESGAPSFNALNATQLLNDNSNNTGVPAIATTADNTTGDSSQETKAKRRSANTTQ